MRNQENLRPSVVVSLTFSIRTHDISLDVYALACTAYWNVYHSSAGISCFSIGCGTAGPFAAARCGAAGAAVACV